MDYEGLRARIGQAADTEKALHDAAGEICDAFLADRLTIYKAVDNATALAAVVQMGLETFGSVKVRIDSNRSIAGYVAAHRCVLNIRDAYDDAELAPLDMQHKMLRVIDERTGYRTTQILAAPILRGEQLVGVIELLNRKDGRRFPKASEKDVATLCEILAPALEKHSSAEVS